MNKCFYIGPIGLENSEVRKRTDSLWEYVIKPICADLGYEALRADLLSVPGNITQDIIHLLLESELVIADITNANPNVMYELGVRHSSGKAVVVITQKGDNIPFDISSYRVLFYSLDSPKDVKELSAGLVKMVRNIEQSDISTSPVLDVLNSYPKRGKAIDSKTEDLEPLGPLLRSVSERIRSLESQVNTISREMPKRKNQAEFTRDVFIVHGHDGELKNELARFLQRLDFNPIILHEQADRGQTILQKLQYESSRVGYAFILHTPDDEGRKRGSSDDTLPRSRQNVVFEHGMFVGQFSHKRVCAIVKEGVEIPSDLSGVIYKRIPIDGNLDSIAFQLVQELRASGYVIDANKLLA